MTLIEKARAGRMNALASLETKTERPTNVISLFSSEPVIETRTAEEIALVRFMNSRDALKRQLAA